MDPKRFYGAKNIVAMDIPDGSEDEGLSDDDSPPIILAADSDYEEDAHANQSDTSIPETDSDSEDYNISLDELQRKLKNNRKNNSHPTWKRGNLVTSEDDLKFLGSADLPPELKEVDSPYAFFNFFLTDEMIKDIVYQSILYSTQKRPQKPLELTEKELEQFIGTCIYMSIVQLPNARSYWNLNLNHRLISDVMSCNRWEEIKRFLHFADNNDAIAAGNPGHDKLFKIRPLLSKLRDQLLKVPKEEYLAIDEQIIPTKARSTIKQYNPQKPHKWGYKAFVLSGVSGFSYDYEIFAGSQSNIVPNDFPNLGVSSNVVLRLTQTVPRHINHKIFFDNWFNSVPLQIYLAQHGMLPLGTVRINRVPNCNMPKETELKKNGRGAMVEKVATIDGTKISVVTWYDNKLVNILSTYAGSTPTVEVKRFSKKDKRHIMVPCPKAVTIYNKYMGGVDLLDSMLGYYRIKLRSKKWYMRIFFHIIDLMVVNAWILWRRSNNEFSNLALADFKMAVAECLCKVNKASFTRKRGRPSAAMETLQNKTRRGPATDFPMHEVRTDGYSHLPLWCLERQRCKYPCGAKTFIKCEKCNVFLCLNKDRNCFYKFHTE